MNNNYNPEGEEIPMTASDKRILIGIGIGVVLLAIVTAVILISMK